MAAVCINRRVSNGDYHNGKCRCYTDEEEEVCREKEEELMCTNPVMR